MSQQKINEFLEKKFGPGHSGQNHLLVERDLGALLAEGVSVDDLREIRPDLVVPYDKAERQSYEKQRRELAAAAKRKVKSEGQGEG